MIGRRKLIYICTGLLGCTAFLAFHPSRPLIMRSEEILVTATDGTQLAATLHLPRWQDRPLGAVVLVHGSGPLTRELVRGDTRALVRQGFAVLSYDKRGCGASGGTYRPGSEHAMDMIIDELAQDAQAMLRTLRARLELQDVPCGYFGASQAAWIIPLASSRSERPADFHVILSGPVMSTALEGYYSHLTGDPPAVVPDERLRAQVRAFDGPAVLDPLPIWKRLDVPTLWLLGDRDGSVPTFVTVANLDALANEGHNEHTIERFSNAGHDLRDADTGEPVALWVRMMEWWKAQPRK
ncbi:MAG: alpha/beta hydrolase family protein [Flavobacteriales bacterium]